MLHERVLGLWFSILLLGAEASGTEELNRILGETVIFQVKTTGPYKTISWNTILGTEFVNIALVTFGESCNLLVLPPAFEKRVNVSKDCRELLLSHVEKKDAGQYRAHIVLQDGNILVESFDLRVFRELLDSQLKVTCASDGAGNGTWQLNCSTWEDRVNISWTSAAKNTDPRPGSSVIQFVSQDLNATCIAENPVSKASRMVSLKQVCAGHSENLYRLHLWALLCLSKVGSLLLLGSLALILRFRTGLLTITMWPSAFHPMPL